LHSRNYLAIVVLDGQFTAGTATTPDLQQLPRPRQRHHRGVWFDVSPLLQRHVYYGPRDGKLLASPQLALGSRLGLISASSAVFPYSGTAHAIIRERHQQRQSSGRTRTQPCGCCTRTTPGILGHTCANHSLAANGRDHSALGNSSAQQQPPPVADASFRGDDDGVRGIRSPALKVPARPCRALMRFSPALTVRQAPVSPRILARHQS